MTIIVEGFPEGFSEKEMITVRGEHYATFRFCAGERSPALIGLVSRAVLDLRLVNLKECANEH